jgi:nicotinate-nucleotide adenylyltransferase
LRVGVLGGSFDPVHAGHLHAARAAQRAFSLDRIVFVPAARAPHKAGGPIASGLERATMLELAIARERGWLVSTVELEREGPSYTIDTLRELRGELGLAGEDGLFLILGGDNLAGLPQWRAASEILQLAQPIVIVRAGDETEVLAALRERWGEQVATQLERGLVREPLVAVSASDLRAALARGEDPGPALPPEVLEYIRARGIYGAQRPKP